MRAKASNTSPFDRLARLVTDQIHDRGPGRPILGAALSLASACFSVLVHLRSRYYDRRGPQLKKLPCRVVSIGNLSLGGTGKTPLCVYLACRIHDAGYRVAIISRGYRSGAEKTGAVVDAGWPLFNAARRVGDEPALMAQMLRKRGIPVLVGRDRISSGQFAWAHYRPDVIIMDDGFQHRCLARDLDIVLLDAVTPLGNGYLLPRGPLREPPSALDRANILVLTRVPSTAAGEPVVNAGRHLVETVSGLAAKPLYTCRHRPVGRERLDTHLSGGPRSRPLDLETLANLPVLAFSGIAHNDTFRQTLIELGGDIRGWVPFRDHYRYRMDDLAGLIREGRRKGARALVTTDKDRVRIHDDWVQELPLLVIGVTIDFTDHRGAFDRSVFEKLNLNTSREKCP